MSREQRIQSIGCRPRFEDFAFGLVMSNEDAAGSVTGVIARMDQHPQEMRHIMQQGQYPFEARAVLHSDFIHASGDGRAGIYFLGTGAENAFGCIGAECRECANRVFERVAEVLPIDIEFTDGIVGSPENAV